MSSVTYSANPTAGVSIVKCTTSSSVGTFTHGIGVAPTFIFGTNTTANNWVVYHSAIGATNYLLLNSTAASAAAASVWNNTAPSSTVVTLGSGAYNAATAVFYCFTPIAGYSAFGSYTGNGLADGTFVFTGFRPRWLMIKRTDVSNEWVIHDTSRATYNLTELGLYASAASAESASGALDILSNGFKQRANYALENTSGGTYIYAAFAENPFKNSLAR